MTGMALGRGGTTSPFNPERLNSGTTVAPTAATVVPRSRQAARDPQNGLWRRAIGTPKHGANNGSHATTASGTNSVTFTNEHPRQEGSSGDSGTASCRTYEGGATVYVTKS